MMDEKAILYIKGNQMVEVIEPTVSLSHIITMECSHPHIVKQLNQLQILKFPKKKYQRTVVSILKIIERIHEKYPTLEIQNLGCTDIIVSYEDQKTPNQFWHYTKAVLVTIVSFIGSAYSIMAFTNDVDTLTIFDQLYVLITGEVADGFNILQFSYCLGLVVGILVFFNHFGRKKIMVDPTPMEIEMRLYEQDIQTTLIETYARKGDEIEVGNTNNLIDHRHQ